MMCFGRRRGNISQFTIGIRLFVAVLSWFAVTSGTAYALTTPTLSVATSDTPSTYGSSVTFTATISSGPTGTIAFYDSGTSIGTGAISGTTATFSTTSLAVGTHTITAGWAGNTNYSAVTSAAVTERVRTATTATLSLSSNSISAGTAVTLTASVRAAAAVSPGLVLFCDASAAHCEDMAVLGTAQLTSAGTAAMGLRLGVGTHRIYAVFVGTSTYAASTSSIQTVVVNSGTGTYASSAILAASGNASNYTLSGTVSGFGPNAPTGLVKFLDTSSGNTQLGSAPLEPAGYILQSPVLYGDNGSYCYDTNCIAVASDVDGDGIPDIVYTNWSANTVSVSIGNGDGTFLTPVSYATGSGSTPGNLAIGDFNGDGVPDLAVSNSGTNTVGIFLGNGNGTFQPQVTYATWTTPEGITVGDFNGDGIEDLLVLDGNINAISVLLGNGDGTFQPQMRAAVVTPHPFAVAVGDFNGDGILDAAVTINTENASTTSVGIFLGNGNGTFQSPITYPAGASLSIAVADFNQDGIPDLVYSNQSGNTVSVMLGNGDGTFQAAVPYTAGSNVGGVAIGDFNQDGIPDIVVQNLATTAILLGNGDGTFQPQIGYSASGGGVAVADLNGDGLPDVVSVNGQLSVLLDAHVANYSASGISFTGPVGVHNVVASYPGSSPYAASTSNTAQLTSSNTTPTLSVSSSGSPSTYGGSVTFTATISSGPTGTVVFYDGATSIGTGTLSGTTATFTTSTLASGSHTITARWAGNSTYSPVTSAAITQVVNLAMPTLGVTTSGTPTTPGGSVTFTATISNGLTGTVTFYDRGTSIGTGTISVATATFVTTTLTVGIHTITASWPGNTSYAPVTSRAITQAVNNTAQTTTLSISPSTVTVGSAVTLTATVKNGSTAISPGLVRFCDASAPECEDMAVLGTAQLTSAGTAAMGLRLGVGTHRIYAVFAGTSTYAASTSSTQTVVVSSGSGTYASSTALLASGNASNYTLNGTVGGLGPTAPTGTVTFLDTSNGNAPLGSATLGSPGYALQGPVLYGDDSTLCYYANCIAVASDVDGDGIPDVVYTNYSSNVVSVSIGNGDGTFQTPVSYATGTTPGYLAVGDFNGDGIPDLAVSNSGSNTVGVFLGNGGGTFQPQVTYATWTTPMGITVGDFNGDGIEDLLVLDGNINAISVLLGNGDGTFQPQMRAAVVTPHPFAVAVGDFNGDGILDAAVTIDTENVSTTAIGIFLGNGNGTFQSPITYPAGASLSIAVADFNQDGIPDLVYSNLHGNTVSVMLGNGDGTFQAAVSYASNTGPVAIGDFNQDGIPDIVTPGTVTTSVLLGNGDGTFQPQISYAATGSGIAVADLNGDGLPDVVSVNDYLSVLLNARVSNYRASSISFTGAVGPHNVVASYPGSSPYAASTSSAVQLTSSNTTPTLSIASSVSPSTYGGSVTFTATISSGPTGTVIFYDGATSIGTGTLSGTTATFTTSTLASGSHTITARWAGNSTYSPVTSSPIAQIVNPVVPTLTVGTSVTPSSFGGSVILTATISNGLTGAVTFYDNGASIGTATISGATATFTTSSLVVGNHTITVGWSGNANFGAFKSGAIIQAVNRATPIISWSTPVPIAYGTALSAAQSNATASGPTTSGAPASVPGTFTYSPALGTIPGGGPQTLFATFAPTDSADYTDATATVVLVVTPVTPTLSVASSGTSSARGASVTFTATISSGPSGPVTFYDGGTWIGASTLSSTTATLTTSSLASGTHSITAAWAGNSNYSSVTSSAITQTVSGIALPGPGIINTVAGNGTCNNSYPSNGTPALSADMCDNLAVAVDSAGNLYYVNSLNSVVQMVTASTGLISTVAGNGQQDGSIGPGDGGPATSAELFTPIGVAVDTSGNIYISDSGTNRIREVAAHTANGHTQGYIYTVAGTGAAGYSQGTNLLATQAMITPNGIAVDASGNIYTSNRFYSVVEKVSASTGFITTVAGGGTGCSQQSDSLGDGCPAATNANLSSPQGIAIDVAGNIYVADAGNNLIRMVNASTGTISTVAGGGTGCTQQYDTLGDGCPATSAKLNDPFGVSVDVAGNIYVADAGNNLIRMVGASTGIINTFAGNGVAGYTGDGGPATLAKISPSQIAVDAGSNVYIAGGNTIRAVGSTSSIVKKASTVTWATPTSIPYGTALSSGQLNATSTLPGIFTYSPAAGTIPAIGQNTLSVSFTPADMTFYNPSSATVLLTVVPATPAIAWVTPASITYGTALSAAQLNATATIPGTFSYAPNSGVLTVGSHTLSVTFTPTDSVDYTSTTTTVVLTVNKATPSITWPAPVDIIKGTALSATQLNASSTIPGTFAYTPASGTVLTEGPHTLSVTFTPTDTTDYTAATATAYVTITQDAGTSDTGTVSLTVNGVLSATSTYGASSTSSSVAEGLAANVQVGSPVKVTAVDDAVYLEAIQAGAGTNYIYNLQATSYDSTHFTQPSFMYPAVSGTLDGGANQNAAGSVVYSYNVPSGGYDGVGNVLSYTDSVMGTWNFTNGYDSLNRLSAGTQTPVTGTAQSFCWTYDSFGNRTAQTVSNQPFTNVPGAATCQLAASASLISNTWTNYDTVNNNNRISNTSQATSGVNYDPVGNVINDGANQYLYDGDGRICAVASTPVSGITTMTGYIYGADGTRVAKGSISTWSCDPSISGFATINDYVLGLGGEQVTEMGMDANNTLAWQHTNVYAVGKLIATYDGGVNTAGGTTGGLHFYLDDPLGTRRAQTDYAGVLEQTCSSLPFGDGLACTGSTQYPTEQHFTGKERDAESGNDYFGARYYASNSARFLSPDWSTKLDPVPYAKLGDPQTLNLYAYVSNNPMISVDADGHVGSWDPFDLLQNGIDNQKDQQAAEKEQQAQTGQNQAQQQNASSDKPGFFRRLGQRFDNLLQHGRFVPDAALHESSTFKIFYSAMGAYQFGSASVSYVPSTGNTIVGGGPGVGDGAAVVVGASRDPEGYLEGWSGTGCGFAGGGGCYGKSPGSANAYMLGLGFGGWGASYTWGAPVELGPFNAYEPGTVKMGDAYFDDEAGTWSSIR